MPDIKNPEDVKNPLPALSDYDWLEFVSFAWKVQREGYSYARDNYGPKFEAPAMKEIADDDQKIRTFYRENKAAVDTWWDTVGGEAACGLQNDHVDESRQREDDACLWGIRCTDDYVITCKSGPARDHTAAELEKHRGNDKGWRVPAALLSRQFPGGEWTESPMPA